jgi:hypothetical protein
VGISAQVLKDPCGPGKGGLAIDDPFLVIEPSSEDLKVTGIFEMADAAGEDQLPRCETVLEIVKELAPEQQRLNSDRDEDPFSASPLLPQKVALCNSVIDETYCPSDIA